MTILLGNGDGTFTATAASPATGSGIPFPLRWATSTATARRTWPWLNNGSSQRHRDDSAGQRGRNIHAGGGEPGDGHSPDSVAVGDFNGDGKADLAVANNGVSTLPVTILLGNGDGTFTPAAASTSTPTFPRGIAVGDFDGDGIPDLVVAALSVSVLLTQQTQTATALPTGISLPANTGTHLVEASYPGDSNFQAAPSGQIALTTGDVAQTITFVNPGTQTYGTSPTLNATASSGLTVSFASTTTPVCTVSGGTVTFVTTGTCGIVANQAGNSNYLAAPSVGHAFTVAKSAQTITFPNLGTQTYGEAPYVLSATASSNLPVSYASTTSTICTVSASTVTLLAIGTCGIMATQPGNSDYAAAAAVGIVFPVIKNQIITFPAIPTTTLVTGTITLNATASSHLPVSYASTNTSVCTVSGSTVTLLNFGTCGIWATQAGNGSIPPAPQVGHAFQVTLATQTITFARPATQTVW